LPLFISMFRFFILFLCFSVVHFFKFLSVSWLLFSLFIFSLHTGFLLCFICHAFCFLPTFFNFSSFFVVLSRSMFIWRSNKIPHARCTLDHVHAPLTPTLLCCHTRTAQWTRSQQKKLKSFNHEIRPPNFFSPSSQPVLHGCPKHSSVANKTHSCYMKLLTINSDCFPKHH
jgi:hypothetical protein